MSAAAPSNRKWKIALVAAIVAGPTLGALTTAWAAQTFPDVPPSNTFYDEIEWGAAHTIINGYTNGKFGPNDNVTRGQSAAFLSHYNDSIHNVKTTVNPPAGGTFVGESQCPVGERPIGGFGSISSANIFVNATHVIGRSFSMVWESEGNVVRDPTGIEVTAICAPAAVG
jgi:hypothetical protein